jgi:hypothetical protein
MDLVLRFEGFISGRLLPRKDEIARSAPENPHEQIPAYLLKPFPTTLPPAGAAVRDRLPGGKTTIFQDDLVNDLSAKDAPPTPEMLVGPEEFFVDHLTTTTIALHTVLLFHSDGQLLAAHSARATDPGSSAGPTRRILSGAPGAESRIEARPSR